MKAYKLFSLTIVMVLISGWSMARPEDKSDKKSMGFCLETYVKTLKSGYTTNYSDIIASDAKFNMNRNGKVFSHGKAEEIAFMKNQTAVQNCEISQQMITMSDSFALISVSMKYGDFTRENILSLANINGSWKIKEVNSVFK